MAAASGRTRKTSGTGGKNRGGGSRASAKGRASCRECGVAMPAGVHFLRKYCGSACAAAVQKRSKRNHMRRRVGVDPVGPRPPCPECGAAVPSGAHGARKYCSPQCSRRVSCRYKYRYYHDLLPARRERPPCLKCGAAIPAWAHHLRKYCDPECAPSPVLAPAPARNRRKEVDA